MSNSFLYPMLPSIINYEGPNGVKLVKWRIQPGHRLSKGTLMFISLNSGKEVKYKANAYGTTLELLVKEGQYIYNHVPIIKYIPCSHPTVMKDLCAECGRDLRELDDTEQKTSASVCMIHSVPELRVTQEQAEKLGKADETRLLKDGKLVLLVDLDQTLIHSTNEPPPEGLKDVFKYQLYGGNTPWYFTKLRPHTSQFLENIASFYELHICTFGARMYAHKIAELLDPSKKYFSHRILSRDECFDPTSKTGNLKALFPCGDSLVCIIDDRQDVWNFAPNLIAVKPYFFFKNTGDINSPYKPKEESFYNVQIGNTQSSSPTPSEPSSSSTPSPSSSQSSSQLPSLSLSSASSTSSSQSASTTSQPQPSTITESLTEKSDQETLVKKVDDKESINVKCLNNNENIMDCDDGGKDDKEKIEQTDKVSESKEDKIVSNETQEAETEIVIEPEISTSSATEVTSQAMEGEKEIKVENEDNMTVETKAKTEEMKTSSSTKIETLKEEESAITSTSEPIKEKSIETPYFSKNSPPSQPTPSSSSASSPDNKEAGDLPDSSEDVTSENKITEDADDYLLYLEDILKRIHKRYFECYKDLIKYSSDDEHIELPDLKKIIPQVRKKTLQGVNIVFSGLIPTNMPPEKSKLHTLAKSLGANVTKEIIFHGSPLEKTTHVIAAKHGTMKVAQALKSGKIRVVNPLWLYCCNERWEKVDEELFTLGKDDDFEEIQERKFRSSPSHSSEPNQPAIGFAGAEGPSTSKSGKNNPPQEFEEYPVYDPLTGKKVIKSRPKTINPSEPSGSGLSSRPSSSKDRSYMQKTDLRPCNMLQFSPLSGFSKNDLQLMDKEVDDACSEGDELSTGNTDSENEDTNQAMVGYKRRPEWESDEDSEMRGEDEEGEEGASYSEYPKGWEKKKSKKFKYACTRLADDEETRDSFAERSDSTSNDDEFNESIGSADEEMAAAVEREFLS